MTCEAPSGVMIAQADNAMIAVAEPRNTSRFSPPLLPISSRVDSERVRSDSSSPPVSIRSIPFPGSRSEPVPHVVCSSCAWGCGPLWSAVGLGKHAFNRNETDDIALATVLTAEKVTCMSTLFIDGRWTSASAGATQEVRSEERRVGKEFRYGRRLKY